PGIPVFPSYRHPPLPDLHSFPTRRSSDLTEAILPDEPSADGLLQLLGGFETRYPPVDGDCLPSFWVAQGAGAPPSDRKRAETDQRDGVTALEGRTDRGQHGPERTFGARLGPPGGLRHAGDEVRSGHLHAESAAGLVHHAFRDGRQALGLGIAF